MTRYTFKVNKIGRKWMEVAVSGKYRAYNAQLLIDDMTRGFAIGETYTIPCRFEDRSNQYGKKYYLYAISEEEYKEKKKEQTIAHGSKLMGYVRKAAQEGYIYKKGIEEIKELGPEVLAMHQDEINKIIRKINTAKVAEEADREEKRKAEKAEREALRKAEEAKYSHLVLPAYCGYKGRPQSGQIIEQKDRIYKVISSYYNDEDGWSFGAMNEEWYSVKCLDITDTQEGQERLAKKAARDAEAKAKLEAAQAEKSRIESLKRAIRENGERVARTEDGEMQDWPEGKALYDNMNIYGGGEAIVKTDTHFWLIINNGTDGGDWSINTIRTGGAGAYGWKIEVGKIEE